MRIMAFGDIHFHHTHRFSHITDSGYTIRELEHLSCADTLIKLYKEENIDAVMFLGDAWQAVGDSISGQTLSVVSTFFDKLTKCFDVHVIVGNHDKLTSNSNVHKLEFLRHFPNIYLYDKPTLGYIVKEDETCDFVFMPYCTHDEEAIRYLENVKDKQNKIVISHLELGGINLGNGVFTQKGVDLALLNQFKMTLQGHYHSGGSYGHRIQIAGSTQRLSFKDKGIARRNIIIYDTKTDVVKRRSFECPDWLTFTDDNIEDLLNHDNNNYVKVELSTDILLTDKLREKLNQMKDKDVHIDLTRISVNKQIEMDLSQEDNTGIIRQFVNKSDNTEEQKEALINEGTRLLEKVS